MLDVNAAAPSPPSRRLVTVWAWSSVASRAAARSLSLPQTTPQCAQPRFARSELRRAATRLSCSVSEVAGRWRELRLERDAEPRINTRLRASPGRVRRAR
jgi:hypothetical protein